MPIPVRITFIAVFIVTSHVVFVALELSRRPRQNDGGHDFVPTGRASHAFTALLFRIGMEAPRHGWFYTTEPCGNALPRYLFPPHVTPPSTCGSSIVPASYTNEKRWV